MKQVKELLIFVGLALAISHQAAAQGTLKAIQVKFDIPDPANRISHYFPYSSNDPMNIIVPPAKVYLRLNKADFTGAKALYLQYQNSSGAWYSVRSGRF